MEMIRGLSGISRFVGLSRWRLPRGLLYKAFLSLLVINFGACAGVKFKDAKLNLSLNYENVNNSAELLSALTSGSQNLNSEESVSPEELPQTSPRAFNGGAYCYVISANGPGVTTIHPDKRQACENAFPGFGHLSAPFEWKTAPMAPPAAVLGVMRFDVIGIKKSMLGGKCPTNLSFSENELGRLVMHINERRVVLNKGIESLSPIFLSKTQVPLMPGENRVPLTVFAWGANAVGRMYGCQDFSVFPTPNSDRVLRTGMRKMFLKVNCPTEADSIQAETSFGKLLGAPALCDARGQAFLNHVEFSDDDLMASEYGWYLPALKIAAYQGHSRIASLSYQLKYSRGGRYGSLKSVDNTENASIVLLPDENQFKIALANETELNIQTKNSVNGEIREYHLGLSSSESAAFAWNGSQNLSILSDGDPFSDTRQVQAKDIFAFLSGSFLKLYDCSNIAICNWTAPAVVAPLGNREQNYFDLSLGDRAPKTVLISRISGVASATIYELAKQPWASDPNTGQALASEPNPEFSPTWNTAEIRFVRSLEFDELKDGIRSNFRDNWVAGGAITDPYRGSTRAVLYRSPNAGKNWYRVYLGPPGSSLVDAASLRGTYPSSSNSRSGEQASFVLLEHRIPTDAHVGTPHELRVLVQDQHGY